MLKTLSIILLLSCFTCTVNANANTDNHGVRKTNLILVTIDGLRWQELFSGADPALLNNKKFVRDSHHIRDKFWHDNNVKRRQLLMPFFWDTVAKNGMVIGNRNIGSNMSIANPWHFSSPGYSEIFTGVVDTSINSNDKILNPQVSFLEWLNNKDGYQKKLAAFGSWDVFPYILNKERSQLHINAGFDSAKGYPLSDEAKLLNNLQKEIPSPWHNVRLDSFTYRYAKDYLLTVKPKVMIISLGETDDFAHDGHYDSYLTSAHQTDAFIADLWHTLQTTQGYKDNTVLMITTDHGRGSNSDDWQHHASKLAVQNTMKNLKAFSKGIVGSENIWFAAMGPGVNARGEIQTITEVKQKQIAATALTLLGEDPKAFNPQAGSIIKEVF
ncbi:phosphoglyceromutase [Colwellia sp. 75C3]|uniref:sulfatase-like hydrolase/transferase n=1 Tax=Colwellia sp. 75C3 TaxID=888425 RepID=UPI000C336FEE|nr:sulfatase-like hydrolase/transferase [Colwellia sp. 75C3]PKG80932.1 phosphoglyceromutase [Colwellia sp. 75C3]